MNRSMAARRPNGRIAIDAGVKSSASTIRVNGSFAASFTFRTSSALCASKRHMHRDSPGTNVLLDVTHGPAVGREALRRRYCSLPGAPEGGHRDPREVPFHHVNSHTP